MAALPGKYNIYARQAHPFTRTFEYRDNDGVLIDLTGYTAFMPVRRQYPSGQLLFELNTDTGGGITIDGPAGTVTPSVNAEFMKDVATGNGYYDLVLVPAGDMAQKFTLVTGQFNVAQRVLPQEG